MPKNIYSVNPSYRKGRDISLKVYLLIFGKGYDEDRKDKPETKENAFSRLRDKNRV